MVKWEIGGGIIENNDLQLSLVSERSNDLLVLRQWKWTLNWIMLSLLANHPTALAHYL